MHQCKPTERASFLQAGGENSLPAEPRAANEGAGGGGGEREEDLGAQIEGPYFSK